MGHIYLASPYTNNNSQLQQMNEYAVNKVFGELIKMGYKKIFAPIAQSAAAVRACPELDGKYDFWAETDEYFVETADEMFIVMLPNWENSYGVAKEVQHCEQSKIPIRFVRVSFWNEVEEITDPIKFVNGEWDIVGYNKLDDAECFQFKRLLDGRNSK
jgi:hypothetical protein